MSVHKIIELSSASEKSWEDAAQKAVSEASKTVQNIKSIYLRDLIADVQDNKIIQYRIHSKVTFEVESKS